MIYLGSAPGTLMLFGEHAVLRGKQAICCAVNQRIHVELTPRQDSIIHLHSLLGEKQFDLNSFVISPPFEFITTTISHYLNEIKTGFNLKISSDFSSTMGLGSSAAVTVATLGALTTWLKKPIIRLELFNIAKEIIIKVQGKGSGADAAAAVFGGIVSYQLQPLKIQSFPIDIPISLVYSGAKTPTKTVIEYVNEKEKSNPLHYENLFEAMHQCAAEAVQILPAENWEKLGNLMNRHQGLQKELGVSTPLIDELITDLCADPAIYGAKISGSGLGDCVIALGELSKNTIFPANERQRQAGVGQIHVKTSNQGLRIGEKSA